MIHIILLTIALIHSANAVISPLDIAPCTVSTNGFIVRCQGLNVTNDVLKRVGPKIASTTPIDIFSILNTSVTEIPANSFPNSDFVNIEIENNANLAKVDGKAFRSPASLVTRSLQFNYNPKYAELGVFELARTLKITYDIHINGNGITEVPSNAFVANLTAKRDLQIIYMNDNKITRINSNAFNGVPELKRLSLLGNRINVIAENGLRFDALDSSTLQVQLSYNELSEKSFVANSVGIPKNTAIAMLMEANKFTTLPEAVFKHLLDNGKASEFYFASSPFNCDCSMKWLLDLPEASKHFGDIYCANAANNVLYTLTLADLKC